MSTQLEHGTTYEIHYIASIGTHSVVTQRMPREQLLRRYLAASYKRIKWDGVSRMAVLVYAEDALAKEIMK